ncbi:hypothetical protein [Arthrobacter sp. B2a2-09]|nr:hypothetical protein [Arthrobacter sp. B2a2-09]
MSKTIEEEPKNGERRYMTPSIVEDGYWVTYRADTRTWERIRD